MTTPYPASLPSKAPLRERYQFDWAQVLEDLQSAGMTQSQIAKRVGTAQPYISQIKRGVRGGAVGYDLGAALLELRAEVWSSRS